VGKVSRSSNQPPVTGKEKIKMKNLIRKSLMLLLAVFTLLPATTNAEAKPLPQGDDETEVVPLTQSDLETFIEQFVEENMADSHTPGLVVTAVYQGEVLLAEGYGLADIESGRPMTPQTNMRAGSVSKPITSTGVLQLAATGQINLNEPISAYVPNFAFDDGFGPAPTLAQLLTLQGGYGDAVVGTHAPTLDQWLPLDEYIEGNPPDRFMPSGKVISYNSWEHALLGYMMAEVSGDPFDIAMSQFLFEPLGMENSTFTQPLPAPIAENLATGYAYDGEYRVVPLDYVKLSPGIALVTTGEDMGRFMQALLNDGWLNRDQVLAPETISGMLQRQEALHDFSRSRTYGFSEINISGRQAIYQDGNGIGHGNRMVLIPEYELGIFLSINHRHLGFDAASTPASTFMKDLSKAIVERYVPAITSEDVPFAPLANASERASRFSGHYRLAGTPQDDFFKLNALLDNVNVKDNQDGTITIGSRRYTEVEPNVFQSKSNPGFFVLFVENSIGEIEWLTFGGTGSYQKVNWYETPTTQFALLGFMLISFLTGIFSTAFSQKRNWIIGLINLLGLVFILGLAFLMTQADLILFYKSIPSTVKLLFLMPWVVSGLSVIYALYLAKVWQTPTATKQKLMYSLNFVSVICFIWFAQYWNLFG
jgi:CubicO group peptidase (beta-lactamase class C family)